MPNRALGLAALLAVIGVSIVFGVIVGGKVNPPPMMLAAPSGSTLQLAVPVTGAHSSSFADIVERSMPAVVSITSTSRGGDRDDDGERRSMEDPFFRFWFGEPEDESRPRVPRRRVGSGSGFLISPDGYVMTNNHVIQDSDKIEVTLHNGDSYSARVVGTDPSIDLALLKIDPEGEQLATLPLGDSGGLRVGEWVIAIGNPHGFDHAVTVGVVSGKERRVPLPNTDFGVVSFIQTDAAINLGNSGGPLLDADGNVIGINTAIRRVDHSEGIGFALPINQATAVVQQLIERGEVRRGWIGIRMSSGIDEATREYYDLPDRDGVLVTWIDPEGPAREAGLNKWDVIRKVDEEPVRDNLDMIAKISSRQPGETVRLNVLRRGQPLDMRLILGDREDGLLADSGGAGRQRRAPDREPEESTGLGVTVESLGGRNREQLGLDEDVRGVVISEVDFESEADDKGLRPTMVIIAVNDNPVHGVGEWEDAMGELRSGAPVKLDIVVQGSDQVFYYFLRVPESE